MDTSISQSHEQDFQSNSTDADNPKQFDHGESATCLQQANMLDDYTSGRDVHIGKPQSLKRGERNNEGLLAVISQWIVEHQTGTQKRLAYPVSNSDPCLRTCHQLALATDHDTRLFSSSPPTYPQIFSSFLLQSPFSKIHFRGG